MDLRLENEDDLNDLSLQKDNLYFALNFLQGLDQRFGPFLYQQEQPINCAEYVKECLYAQISLINNKIEEYNFHNK